MICRIYRLPIRSEQIFKLGTPCSKTIRAWARVSLHKTLRVDPKNPPSCLAYCSWFDREQRKREMSVNNTNQCHVKPSCVVSGRFDWFGSRKRTCKSRAQQTENRPETPKTSGRKWAIRQMDMADLDDLNNDFGLFTPSKKKKVTNLRREVRRRRIKLYPKKNFFLP